MRIVLVTGGFDPLHSGHLLYFKAAKQLGDLLYVGVMCDDFLIKKKGRAFMGEDERLHLVSSLKCVDKAILCESDKYVDKLILDVKPHIFANGGDRSCLTQMPESEINACRQVGAIIAIGVGGYDKINSSSKLIEEARDYEKSRNTNKVTE